MSRPTKYSPEMEKAICDRLKAGCTRKAACLSQGVSEDSFERWVVRYAAFAEAVTRAEADAETRATVALVKGFTGEDGDWRAAESWLKRRRNRDWGDTLKTDASVNVNGKMTHDHRDADEEAIIAAADAIRARRASLPVLP